MSVPKKHHFLPEFYLKAWCTEDGRLARFRKPTSRKILLEQKFPSETGFEEFLYTLQNLPAGEAQQIETGFFSPLDSRAASALKDLRAMGTIAGELEKAWWDFVASLMVRMPADVRKHRELQTKLATTVLPALARVTELDEFADMANEIDSASERLQGESVDQSTRSLSELIINENLQRRLQSLRWAVLSTQSAKHELMTSDRPVYFDKGARFSGFVLMLPISPSLLFIGAQNLAVLEDASSKTRNAIVREVNAAIVGGAEEYVVARSPTQRVYVTANMGKNKRETFMELFEQVVDAGLPGIESGMQMGFEDYRQQSKST